MGANTMGMITMDKKVFIFNNGGHDYSDAERFGTLHFITIPPEAKWDFALLFEILRKGLEDAKEDDYILISSLTSVCCIATALFVEWFGRVQYLVYKGGKYEAKLIVLDRT